jgi:hypothetical protein
MNLHFACVYVLLLSSAAVWDECEGFTRLVVEPGRSVTKTVRILRESTVQIEQDFVDQESISKLRFRQLQQACKRMGLPTSGTTGSLRNRLRDHLCESQPGFGMEDDGDDKEVCDVSKLRDTNHSMP